MKQARWRFRAGWTQALLKARVPILAASDAAVGSLPLGAGLHLEVESLVRAGLTPLEAIRSATAIAAEHMAATAIPTERPRWARLGTLVSGKTADIVLLRANPLEHISNIRRVQFVIKDGKVYRPDALSVPVP